MKLKHPPIHLIAKSGDKATICGLRDTAGPRVPYLLAKYRAGHQAAHAARGRTVTFCPDCLNQQETNP